MPRPGWRSSSGPGPARRARRGRLAACAAAAVPRRRRGRRRASRGTARPRSDRRAGCAPRRHAHRARPGRPGRLRARPGRRARPPVRSSGLSGPAGRQGPGAAARRWPLPLGLADTGVSSPAGAPSVDAPPAGPPSGAPSAEALRPRPGALGRDRPREPRPDRSVPFVAAVRRFRDGRSAPGFGGPPASRRPGSVPRSAGRSTLAPHRRQMPASSFRATGPASASWRAPSGSRFVVKSHFG